MTEGVPARSCRLLDPTERFSGVSFGLITVLTFTDTLGVAF